MESECNLPLNICFKFASLTLFSESVPPTPSLSSWLDYADNYHSFIRYGPKEFAGNAVKPYFQGTPSQMHRLSQNLETSFFIASYLNS